MSSFGNGFPPPGPLWRDSSDEKPLEAQFASGKNTSVEVAVIGAGYTGLSCALHLAERGMQVAVFEAGLVGEGASGLNGGQVLPGLKRDPDDLERLFPGRGNLIAQHFGDAPRMVFSLIERHAIRCNPVREGWIQAAHAPLAMQAIEERRNQWTSRGASIDLLSAEAVERLTGTKAYVGGMIDRRAGTVQPLAYARGLATAAQALGASIYEHSKIEELERLGDGWLLKGRGFEAKANQVVIATDAYSGPLLPILQRSLLTVSSLQIATEPLASEFSDIFSTRACLSETRKVAIYMRRDPDGRLLIGGRGPVGDAASTGLYSNLQDRLTTLFPQLRGVSIAYRWQGTVGLTMDELPHVHQPSPGLHIGLGYNGRGVAGATLMGKILADRAAGGELSELIPVTRLTKIPLRLLRQPLLAAAVSYYRMRDRLGFGS